MTRFEDQAKPDPDPNYFLKPILSHDRTVFMLVKKRELCRIRIIKRSKN